MLDACGAVRAWSIEAYALRYDHLVGRGGLRDELQEAVQAKDEKDEGGALLVGLDQDQLGVLLRQNRETRLVARCHSVADGEAIAVHFYDPSCRRDISVTERIQLALETSAGEERDTEDARIGADRKCVSVVAHAAGEDNELVGPVRRRETAGLPLRLAAIVRGRSQI